MVKGAYEVLCPAATYAGAMSAGIPAPYIIDRIRQREQRPDSYQIPVELPLPRPTQVEYAPVPSTRGVATIDFTVGTDNIGTNNCDFSI